MILYFICFIIIYSIIVCALLFYSMLRLDNNSSVRKVVGQVVCLSILLVVDKVEIHRLEVFREVHGVLV
jgi:hypothetical protein